MTFTQIAGHIGKDAETRFTQDGKKVTSFSVATNKRKAGQEVTIWYRVTIWGDQFDNMIPYLKKGSAVIVIGDFEARLYTDKDNKPQISYELTARMINFSPFGKSEKSRENQQSQPEASSPYGSSEPFKGGYQPNNGAQQAQFDEEFDKLPF